MEINECAGVECSRPAIKRGFCGAHYQQDKKYGYTWKLGSKKRQRKTCLFEGCEKNNFAHGYCQGHAAQIRRGQPLTPLRLPRPDAAEGYRWCSHCKQFQPIEDFTISSDRPDGLQRVCNMCRAEYMREYNARNRDKIRLQVITKKWGITEEQYKALFEAQDHKCAICGSERREWRALAIDHDHQTGTFRGLLCQDCNMALGLFKDDPDRLEAAAKYLRAGGVIHDPTLKVPIQT